MRVIRDFHACPKALHGTVAAVGNFDGVHLGHQEILRINADRAKSLGAKTSVLTFEPPPRVFFTKGDPPTRLYPLARKLRMLKDTGLVDVVFLARFNAAFAAMSALTFVETILCQQLKVRHVVTGYNFAFGRGREGDASDLTAWSRDHGFGYTCVSPIGDAHGHPVSSSIVREMLAAGQMTEAARLLGRPYAISGRVQKGDARGRDLGYPTANIALGALFRPRFGIYAARVLHNNKSYDAVVSLGIRPMFALEMPQLEVHIFDFSGSLYGEQIEVQLVSFIRDEERFASVETLKAQMAEDCAAARSILVEKKVAHG